jgi:hypothetical protein
MQKVRANAAAQGYELMLDRWSYRQAIVPGLESHLVLQYSLTAPMGESRFSVLIPRTSGVVHIIPILRGGSTTSVSADSNSIILQVCNEMIRQNASLLPRDSYGEFEWSRVALLYGALLGQAPELSFDKVESVRPIPRRLNGKSSDSWITFIDDHTGKVPGGWSLKVNRNGEITAASSNLYLEHNQKMDKTGYTRVVPNDILPPGRTVPALSQLESKPVPTNQLPQGKPVNQ